MQLYYVKGNYRLRRPSGFPLEPQVVKKLACAS